MTDPNIQGKRIVVLDLEGPSFRLDRGGQVSYQSVTFSRKYSGLGLLILPRDVTLPAINPSSREGEAALRGLVQRVLQARESGTHVCIFTSDNSIPELSLPGALIPDRVKVTGDDASLEFSTDIPEVEELVRIYGRQDIQIEYEPGPNQEIVPILTGIGAEHVVKGIMDTSLPGHLFIMPVHPLPDDIRTFIQKLIEAVEATLRHRYERVTHPIVDDYRFKQEQQLITRREELREHVEKLEQEISGYREKRRLLYLRNFQLEKELPAWARDNLGLDIEHEEGRFEDFWIVEGDDPERIAIGETKGISKNVKKAHVTALIQHRQENDRPEEFPSLLVVNTYADEGTVEAKDRQRVSPDVVAWAVKNSVLIVRTLDLVRLSDIGDQGRIDTTEIKDKLVGNSGWLHVGGDEIIELVME